MCICSGCCPLKNYILSGRGIGLKVIASVSLLISLIVAICSPLVLISVLEENGLDEVINKAPVVTIENGRIVDPVFDNETIVIPATAYPDEDIQIILNTTIDNLPSIPQNINAYVTAKNIYLKDNMQYRVITLPNDLNVVITHEFLKDYVKKIVWASGIAFGFFLFLVSIFLFFILYLIVILLGWLFNKNLTLDAWGRALSWPWAIIWCLIILNAAFAVVVLPLTYVLAIPVLLTWIIGASLYNRSTCIKNEENALVPETSEEDTAEKEILVAHPVQEETQQVVQHSENVKPVARAQKTASKTTKKAAVKSKNVPPVQRRKKKK